MILVTLFLFLFGVVIGSFLNVLVIRTIKGGSPWKGRSKCPYCKRQLSWKENIPLLSFFLLGGKCAHCKKKISWQYPIVELLTGLLFVWWFVIGRGVFALVESPFVIVQPMFWLVIGVMLLLVVVFDLWYGIIPDELSVSIFATVFLYRVFLSSRGVMQLVDLRNGLLASLLVYLFFWGLHKLTRGKGMGFGDVKLVPSLGLLLGWPAILVGMLVSFVSGAAVGVVLMFTRVRKLKQSIPFGPFLVLGTVVALLWGDSIWSWYVGLLLG